MKATLAGIAAFLVFVTPPAIAGEPLWVNIAQLFGSDTDSSDLFGHTVSLDGDILVVGAYLKADGVAYIFERLPEPPTRWVEVKKLTATDPTDENFGIFVSVSGDTVVVTSSEHDDVFPSATYIYERDAGGPGEWGLVSRYVPGGLLIDGDTMAKGEGDFEADGLFAAGGVHLFERDQQDPYAWHYTTTLTASDAQGGDRLGERVALSGDRLLAGAVHVRDLGRDAGAAYVFERQQNGLWSEVAKLLASDGTDSDQFGYRVDLDADTAIIGTSSFGDDEGAYIFERDPMGAWLEQKKLLPLGAGTTFGPDVGISGSVAVAGEWGYQDAGAAYVFERDHGAPDSWGTAALVTAPDPQVHDEFGSELDLDGNTLAVGVPADDDRGAAAGTVYLFSRTAPLLAVTGSCPGKLEVTVIGTTPAGRAVLLGAQSEGITPIPLGPCEGTEVNLDRPKVLFAGRATSGGDLSLAPIVGEAACGRYLQAIDIGTCVTTAVAQSP